ncbi:MAG: tryptophan synthase subunit alpha [Gammaproteobacteria bacterium]|nr:tryptophan synthase subunit alpha [Gammaproteobacteria bacterium]
MNRLVARFAALRAVQRKALIPFITAADPTPEVTVPLMHAMVAAGADILELGMPFSDPMAEGPAIQAANERSLRQPIGLRGVLAMVQQFRARDAVTPVVLMGYLNPVEAMGYTVFAEAAAKAGADAVLIVDAPPEEAGPLRAAMHAQGLEQVFLIAPTTSVERMAKICAASSGFVYYVSLKGVTGAKTLDVSEVARKVDLIHTVTDLPVGVGFGIHDAASAAAVARVADAVVVGSAVVNRIAAQINTPERIIPEVTEFLAGLRRAMDHR